MTYSCDACQACDSNPRLDLFATSCASCTARAVALITLPADALSMAPTLEQLFPGQTAQGFELVQQWRSRINAFEALHPIRR